MTVCPAPSHGTASAARKRGCVCPDALAELDAYRARQTVQRQAQRAAQRRAAGIPPRDYTDTVDAPDFYSPDIPEARPIGAVGQRVLFGTDAACAGMSTDLFFSPDQRERAAAKRVCRGCPLMDDCLTVALAGDEWGVWGGTDDDDRLAIRSRFTARPRTA